MPKKIPRARYESLWRNSPFTSKPIIEEGPAPESPINDYVLIGVSSLGGTGANTKYRVTLVNKKNPEAERKYVDSDNPRPPDNFKIEKVTRTPGDPMGTTVTLRSGSNVGTVAYDEKLLTIAAAKPAAAPNAGAPQEPTNPANQNNPPRAGSLPNQGQVQPGQVRPPRPRVIAPPAAPPGAATSGTPQPAVQGESSTGRRPDRRRSY